MDSIKAGAHRLDDGTTIYVCDCSACLHKTGGRNTQVSKATYFRHKASRPSICLPPVPFTIAPDLPSLDLPAEFSSSKRPQELREDFDDKEVRSRKKGRSDSLELAPSFEPELQPDDSSIHMNDLDGIRMDNDTIEEFYQDDGLEHGAVPENFPDEAHEELPQYLDQPHDSLSAAQPDEALPPNDHIDIDAHDRHEDPYEPDVQPEHHDLDLDQSRG
ncbi:hypothetical protein EV424DRAFT_1543348 [Suillus variegatus]|nr:hypothetical protein EV424DRAFT_1543348 [Suillus variegatus]